LKIVAKCLQCKGAVMVQVAACQDEACPLHSCGPGLALLDMGTCHQGEGHNHADCN
jgi:hypothetical protein